MSQTTQSLTDDQYLAAVGPPLRMEVDIRVADQTLDLEYKIKNIRNKPIYLFNVLWDWDKTGQYVASPNPVYACLKQDGLVHLAKQILPLPRNRKVELRIVPFATKVEPGQEYGEKLELPLPLREYNPYFPFGEQSKHKLMTAQGVVFSLQYVGEMEDLKAPPAPLPGALQVQYPRLLGRVETLRSNVARLAVPVNKRTDPFEEF